MPQNQSNPSVIPADEARSRGGYSTAAFAIKCGGMRPASIRTAVWRHGHFYGIRPIKLGAGRNARLIWPADEVDALLERGAQ